MRPRLGSWLVAPPNLMKQQTLAATQMKQTQLILLPLIRVGPAAHTLVNPYEPPAVTACLYLHLGEKGNKHVSQSFFTQTWSHPPCVRVQTVCSGSG